MRLIHRLIGALVSSSWGSRALIRYAKRTPHVHLHDRDGGRYMGRWRVVDEGTLGGRLLEALTGYSSIRLHHIMRPDHDRDLHSHPFAYRTFIVRGFYAEHYLDEVPANHDWSLGDYPTGYRVLFSGDTGTGSATKYHRISDVGPQGVWTLFCMTRNQGPWGFLVAGKLVDSVRYLLRRGYPKDSVRGVQQ